MHLRAAEFLGFDHLTDGGFDQRWPGEIEAAAFGHQNLVAENGQIRAAGDAVAHDRGELRNARGGDDGVVAEDAPEIVLVREDLVLHRQKDSRGIDQIDDRHVAFEADPLCADDLLRGLRKEGACLHGGVVRDDHARHAGDVANAGDRTRGRNAAPLLIHLIGGPKADLEKRRAFIKKLRDSFPRKKTPEFVLPFLPGFAAAFAQHGFFIGNCRTPLAQRIS